MVSWPIENNTEFANINRNLLILHLIFFQESITIEVSKKNAMFAAIVNFFEKTKAF